MDFIIVFLIFKETGTKVWWTTWDRD